MQTFREASSLYNLATLSAPIVSQDHLYYVKTTLDAEKDDYQSGIYRLHLETGQEEALVADGFKNSCPSIQGDQLLFLSNRNGITQVFQKNLDNGQAQQLTFSPHPVTYVRWLPGGQSFLFASELSKAVPQTFYWEQLAETDQKEPAPYYRIAHMKYQANGSGFLNTETSRYLCEQDLATGEVTVLSTQFTGYGLRRVADTDAAGKTVYFERRLVEDDDYNNDSGVFSYDRQTGATSALIPTHQTGIFSEGAVSPDGNYIAMVGNPLPYETPNQFDLYLYDTRQETLANLSEGKDIQFADNSVSDFFQNVRNPLIQWHPDGNSFYVQTSEYGNVHLYQVTLDGKMARISPVGAVVKEFVLGETGDVYAFISEPHQPLQLSKFSKGEWSSIATPLERHYQDYRFAQYQEVAYTAADGGTVHGYLVLPPDFQPSQKYPLILNIHGGPYTMHAANFFHEAQYMAANGYLVLLVNPRGSYGYGQNHTYGVYERYGKEDYTDLMTAVEGVVEEFAFVDEEQLFVTGGSYGGFMTNWIITQTNRFKAAVTQRSMSNFVSMFGTSDIGYFFYKDETGFDLAQADKLWEMSPLAHVQQVETPLLLIHPLDDLRCPFEQAQQFYNGLKHFGKTAEMLLFPDSHHELSRTGRPSYRVARLEGIVDWFNQYRS